MRVAIPNKRNVLRDARGTETTKVPQMTLVLELDSSNAWRAASRFIHMLYIVAALTLRENNVYSFARSIIALPTELSHARSYSKHLGFARILMSMSRRHRPLANDLTMAHSS